MTEPVAVSLRQAAVPRAVTPSTILAELLSQACQQLEAFPGIDGSLLSQLRSARDLAVGIDPYLAQCTTPESSALAELASRTIGMDWAAVDSGRHTVQLEQEMLSGHLEGQFLKFLVRVAGARQVLEIGMFTGYSALAMAEGLPADGTVLACELDPAVADFARDFFKRAADGHKISVEVGPAMETLKRLSESRTSVDGPRFDFVFIDADKTGYTDYVEYLLDSSLLAPGAVIAVDNTLLQGEPYSGAVNISPNGTAIARFNAGLTYDDRIEQVLLPLRDGLTLITKSSL